MFRQMAKALAAPLLRAPIGNNVQRRGIAPVCSPPRNPLSTADKLIYGGGLIVTIMLVPIISLFSIPKWAYKEPEVPEPQEEVEPGEEGAEE